MPGPFRRLLQWFLAEVDKDYRFRDQVGGTLLLAQRSDDRTELLTALRRVEPTSLVRVEVSDIGFLRSGLIDVSERDLVIPQRLLNGLHGGPRRVLCLLRYADCLVAKAGADQPVSLRDTWEEAFAAQPDEVAEVYRTEAREWVLSNFKAVRSKHPLRREAP
ncbi:MAG: hypothetical protein Q8S33_19530 [Myxococcales bacterium]|nr:hypothetical protein [Myxococcales bacterium]